MAVYQREESGGFTLIELMIVILIIAILVAIAIPVFLSARNSSWKRTCQSNIRTINGAVNTYYAEALSYPGAVAEMTGGVYGCLKSIPRCPRVGVGYGLVTGSPPETSCPSGPSAASWDHTI